jgi:hypothetical protein
MKLSISFVLHYFPHAATDEGACRWNKEKQAFLFPLCNAVTFNNAYNSSLTRIINNRMQSKYLTLR